MFTKELKILLAGFKRRLVCIKSLTINCHNITNRNKGIRIDLLDRLKYNV